MRDAGGSIASVIEQFQSRGYSWYVLENHHDPKSYFDATPRPPRRGTAIPTQRTDIIFSRESSDSLV